MGFSQLFNEKAVTGGQYSVTADAHALAPQATADLRHDNEQAKIAARQEETLNNLAKQDVDYIMGRASPQDSKKEVEVKKKKERTLFDQIREQILRANRILEQMEFTIVKSLTAEEAILENLKERLVERIAVDRAKKLLDNGGVLERDANGKLKDPALQKAVEKLQAKSDVKDVSDDAVVLALINKHLPTMPTSRELRSEIMVQEHVTQALRGCETNRQKLAKAGQTIEDKSDEEKEQHIKNVNDLDRKVENFTNELNTTNDLKAKGLISDEEAMNRKLETLERYDNDVVNKYRSENLSSAKEIDEARKEKSLEAKNNLTMQGNPLVALQQQNKSSAADDNTQTAQVTKNTLPSPM